MMDEAEVLARYHADTPYQAGANLADELGQVLVRFLEDRLAPITIELQKRGEDARPLVAALVGGAKDALDTFASAFERTYVDAGWPPRS